MRRGAERDSVQRHPRRWHRPRATSASCDLPYAEAKALVLHELERRYLADVLARTDHNLSAASRASGIDRKHLRTLARKHGLIDDRSGDPTGDPGRRPDWRRRRMTRIGHRTRTTTAEMLSREPAA
jgi:DNA-binding protein Fis